MTETSRVLPDAPGLSRYSINLQTLPNTPFSEQLTTIAATGTAGVGIAQPFVPSHLSGEDVARALEDAGLAATLCMPDTLFFSPFYLYSRAERARVPVGSVGSDGKPGAFCPDRQVEKIIEGLRWLAPLEPASVVLWTGAQGDRSAAEAWEMSVEGLRRVDDEAKKLGLSLALEPCNPRYAYDWTILETIDRALALIDDVGSDNIGVLIDVFHVWETADLLGQIERAAGRISGVHIVDIAQTPRSCVDRLIPGDGVADLPALIRAVEDTGFRGWYDCEFVTDPDFPDSAALFEMPVEEIARRCVTGFVEAGASAFAQA